MKLTAINFPCGCVAKPQDQHGVHWKLTHCRPDAEATDDLLAACKVLVHKMREICDFTPGQKADPLSMIGRSEAVIAEAEKKGES